MPERAPTPRTIRVELGERGYDVRVGAGLLESLGEAVRDRLGAGGHRPVRRAMLVRDAGVPEGFAAQASLSLERAGIEVRTFELVASEHEKTIANSERICAEMARAKMERQEPLIALGGGIVGDVAGFAASMYRRGVPVVQCPTTLLSMVDAAVGGKTGANLVVRDDRGGTSLLKNLVGAFHQPSLVVADVSTLDSLPDRQLRAGLAECLKHGMLAGGVEGSQERGAALFEAVVRDARSILARERGALVDLVARNIAIKALVVAGDERELSTDPRGGRAALNLGHTFGHAIETMPGLTPDGDPAHAPLHHGEAVGLGLHAAAWTGVALGMTTEGEARRVGEALKLVGLPATVAGLPESGTLLARMGDDKKVSGGRLRVIVPEGLGRVRLIDSPPVQAIEAGWDAIRPG